MTKASPSPAGGVAPFRRGTSHPSLFPSEPLPTADGDLIVTAGNDAQFRKLCEVLGAPGLADDSRFTTNARRTANREQLRPLLAERLATRPAADWFRDLIGVGVPCGPIYKMNEVFDDPQVRHLGMAAPVPRPGGGELSLVGPAIRLSRAGWWVRLPHASAKLLICKGLCCGLCSHRNICSH